MKEWLALFLASGCYIGLIPGAPGTYASIATTLAFFLIHQASNRIIPELHLSAICLLTTAGTLASAEIERRRGIEDPQYVVIDEIAGQLIALFLIPFSLTNLILATALFRAFDIWKPYPIRRLEDLPNGVGHHGGRSDGGSLRKPRCPSCKLVGPQGNLLALSYLAVSDRTRAGSQFVVCVLCGPVMKACHKETDS